MCLAGQGLCDGERAGVCLSEEIGQERDGEERGSVPRRSIGLARALCHRGGRTSPCWALGDTQRGEHGAAGPVAQTPSPVLPSIPASIPPNAGSSPQAQPKSAVAGGPCPPARLQPQRAPPPATVPGDGISKTCGRLILRPPRSRRTGVWEGGRDNPRLQPSRSSKEQD